MHRPARITWLSWHWHQRTASIVEEWGIDWVMLDTRRRGVPRYLELLARSGMALWRLRTTTVIVQSPSVLLAFMAVALAPVLRLRVSIDAHNEAIQPFAHDSALMRWLLRATMTRAERVIVTNDELACVVATQGGRPFVLPDAIPVPPPCTTPRQHEGLPAVLVVCTYAADEPLDVFVDTARRLRGVAEVRLTGRPSARALDTLADAPDNLRALGFLSEHDYWAELRSAEVIVDLTLKSNCLVCGAYEAIAVNKSPVLSDDVSNRKLFGEVAFFARNSAESLTGVILDRLALPVTSGESISVFRSRYMDDWRKKLAELHALLAVAP
jgi:hypothetical protein